MVINLLIILSDEEKINIEPLLELGSLKTL